MNTRNSMQHTSIHDYEEGSALRPPPMRVAVLRLLGCVARTVNLVAQRRICQPTERIGQEMTFADGTTGIVYRETIVKGPPPADPVVLVVTFRLRGIHGRAHALFRAESLFNTPLFVGFPGFVSKLWLSADEENRYRGFYQWDGERSAREYACTLWWILALVCSLDSIRYRVLPGAFRDYVLADTLSAGKAMPEGAMSPTDAVWWRLVQERKP